MPWICLAKRFRLALAGAAVLVAAFTTHPAEAAKRVALLIGNAAYQHAPALANPIRDVRLIEERLKAADFEVVVGTDLDRIATEEIIRRFLRSLDPDDVALFFYSGHAVQVNDTNFIVPVEARLSAPSDLEIEAISMSNLIRYMDDRAAIQLIFIDACRDNPFEGRAFAVGTTRAVAAGTRGLARPSAELGSLIAYSTAPGQVAVDGTDANSPFSAALAARMLTPALEIRQLLTQVRKDVMEATGNEQIPWENSSLVSDFFFVERKNPPKVTALHRVEVAMVGDPIGLGIPTPWTEDGATLDVVLTAVPEHGAALLDGRPLKAGDQIEADALARIAYRPEPGRPLTEMLGYEVRDPTGQTVPAIVAITVDSQAAPTETPKPAGTTLAALSEALSGEAATRTLDPTIGIGPVPLDLGLAAEAAEGARIRIAAAPEDGTLFLGGRAMPAGTLLAAADLKGLAILPAIGSEGRRTTLRLAPVDAAGAEGRAVEVAITPRLDPCDIEAGDRLDLQSPALGVLPNDIKVASAEAACLEAAGAYPTVPRFFYALGRVMAAKGDIGRALELFRLASAQGHVRADYALGRMYFLGGGVPRDSVKAKEHYEKIIDTGDPFAMHALGKMLYRGDGLPQDRKRGLTLLLQAAEMGHSFAMNELGSIFLDGTGVAKDTVRAKGFFEASAARGDIYGFNNLAILYRDGTGVPKDPKKALELFIKASEGGHPYAANNIGRLYFDGNGVEKSLETAAAWYEVSAARGNAFAAMNRAWIAIHGPDAMRDPIEAAMFLGQAIAFDLEGKVSAEARQTLAGLDEQSRWRAVQILMNALGFAVGEPDGRPGPATRAAAERFRTEAGAGADDGVDALVVALSRAKWLKAKPRFDLF